MVQLLSASSLPRTERWSHKELKTKQTRSQVSSLWASVDEHLLEESTVKHSPFHRQFRFPIANLFGSFYFIGSFYYLLKTCLL